MHLLNFFLYQANKSLVILYKPNADFAFYPKNRASIDSSPFNTLQLSFYKAKFYTYLKQRQCNCMHYTWYNCLVSLKVNADCAGSICIYLSIKYIIAMLCFPLRSGIRLWIAEISGTWRSALCAFSAITTLYF